MILSVNPAFNCRQLTICKIVWFQSSPKKLIKKKNASPWLGCPSVSRFRSTWRLSCPTVNSTNSGKGQVEKGRTWFAIEMRLAKCVCAVGLEVSSRKGRKMVWPFVCCFGSSNGRPVEWPRNEFRPSKAQEPFSATLCRPESDSSLGNRLAIDCIRSELIKDIRRSVFDLFTQEENKSVSKHPFSKRSTPNSKLLCSKVDKRAQVVTKSSRQERVSRVIKKRAFEEQRSLGSAFN